MTPWTVPFAGAEFKRTGGAASRVARTIAVTVRITHLTNEQKPAG
jgi:hypothetical protein